MNNSIQTLIEAHREMIEGENPYAYFELAYTRQTEWMAWICSKPSEQDPNRKVLAKGQGETPEEACSDALKYLAAHLNVTPGENDDPIKQKSGEGCPEATYSPVFLVLQEFTSGGSKYYRCADDIQRPLLSHFLNGAGGCFFAEELPTVQCVANTHGWELQILVENTQVQTRPDDA